MPAPIRPLAVYVVLLCLLGSMSGRAEDAEKYGPAAALDFSRSYRGEAYKPDELTCYPEAVGVPFADCENIIPMNASLWTPEQLSADFHRRMATLPPHERKKGIIVLLKTERCAPKAVRFCTTTTAALEKRSTPLAAEFLIYGVLLKPRDRDIPPGSLKIETGSDAWKNDVAGEYRFRQGPGATVAFLHPADGSLVDCTDAARLGLSERKFHQNAGRTPELHVMLQTVLARLQRQTTTNGLN